MLKLLACSISFRHRGSSLEDIVRWLGREGFDGLELWGAHARAAERESGASWLQEHGVSALMLSDYLALDGTSDELRRGIDELTRLAQRWGAPKLRVFAGGRGSAEVAPEERRRLVDRLREACVRVADAGLSLLVETHPRTLADTTEATQRLLDDVNHPALRINFDVLHLWQGGDDPVQALATLAPFVSHYHLKNVSSRAELDVFTPENVLSPSGSRDGMVGLFEGALDYRSIVRALPAGAHASLEWFGGDVEATLSRDRNAVLALLKPADT